MSDYIAEQVTRYRLHNANPQATPNGALARYLASVAEQEAQRPDEIGELLDVLWQRHADGHGLDEASRP